MTRRTRTRRKPAPALAAFALGTLAADRPRCEPVEIDDPTNAALDTIESHVREVIRDGGEPALLARLHRLMPANVVVDGRLGAAAGTPAAGGSVSPPCRVGGSKSLITGSN